MKTIFISSVQKEFAAERAALRDYLRADPLLKRFFEVFLFEDLPASDRRADAVYLREAADCDLYLGLFGEEYGAAGPGLSPTEREFNRAAALGKPRLIYVKGADDKSKHPRMRALIRRAGGELIRRRFADPATLLPAVYASLVDYLEERRLILNGPFDAAPCRGAAIKDLSREAGLRAPEFRLDDGFALTLRRREYSSGNARVPATATPVKTPVKMLVKTPVKILRLLERNPQMTLAEAAGEIGKSLSAVERAAAKLVKTGRLSHVGPQKGGHWEVRSETGNA